MHSVPLTCPGDDRRPMTKLALRGLYPATVTPFDDDLAVDFVALEKHLVATKDSQGVAGLVVNGGLGELFTLDLEEQCQIIQVARELVNPEQPVIAGIDARTVGDGVRRGRALQEAGAQGLLV